MANSVTIDVKVTGRDRIKALKQAMISLAPAAVPVAAAMVPLAANTAAAGVAVAGFGAAVIPQIMHLSDAKKAQDKYTEAVAQHGRASKQAVQAETEYLRTFGKLPPATQEASVAFGMLTKSYKTWSDNLADDTMPVFTKSFAVFKGMLPGTVPLVQGAAEQLDRLVTAAGGGVGGGAFDQLASSMAGFATGALQKTVDGIIHLSRALSEGKANGPVSEFMDYVHTNGPAVAGALRNLARAIGNLVEGAADAGPGMLALVNAMARLIASVPPEVIGRLLQLYTAFKLVRVGALLAAAGAGSILKLRTALFAMQRAAVVAGGGLAGLQAAFMSLSVAGRATVVLAAIGVLVVGLRKLAGIGRSAPPNVDRLTTALGNLGRTGRVAGEAARAFGADLGGLGSALRTLSRPSNLDKTQQFLTSLVGMDSTPVKNAKQALDAVDKSLTSLVKGGHADLAGQAFDRIAAAMRKQGMTSGELRGKLDDYKSALADQAFEQQLAAQSMGLFGQQAQDVQQKLAAQKQSADGLRQSIQALNDVQRQGLGGMIGFEAAIDAATEAAKKNAGALRMVHGRLDLNSEKARNAATALNDLAAKTDEAAAQARDSGKSWSYVNGIYDRGRAKLIAAGQQMGLTRAQAKLLADQILKTPDKTARLRGNLEDLEDKLHKAKRDLKRVPDSRKAAIRARIDQLKRAIAEAKGAINSVHGRTVTIYVRRVMQQVLTWTPFGNAAGGVVAGGPAPATAATGGARGALTLVGEQGPELVRLPFGSMVRSNPDSRRLAAAGTGGGGRPPLVLEIRSGGTQMDDLLVEILRKAIRVQGGDVQAVLGRG